MTTPIAPADKTALQNYDSTMDAALAAAPSRTDITAAQNAQMTAWLNKTIADARAALSAGGLSDP